MSGAACRPPGMIATVTWIATAISLGSCEPHRGCGRGIAERWSQQWHRTALHATTGRIRADANSARGSASGHAPQPHHQTYARRSMRQDVPGLGAPRARTLGNDSFSLPDSQKRRARTTLARDGTLFEHHRSRAWSRRAAAVLLHVDTCSGRVYAPRRHRPWRRIRLTTSVGCSRRRTPAPSFRTCSQHIRAPR